MRGKYTSTTGPVDLARLLDAMSAVPDDRFVPSWIVAPTHDAFTVLERLDRAVGETSRKVRALRRGLVPSWAEDPCGGARTGSDEVSLRSGRQPARRAGRGGPARGPARPGTGRSPADECEDLGRAAPYLGSALLALAMGSPRRAAFQTDRTNSLLDVCPA
ncbi:SOS response-associated peptidase family protein [Kitasatospora sp. NPDC059327]|uniref:SOS response-associated peptidase family protein n=1 Tax=Kitasatospora sp. NPDC059327 TaxID=3346803 RepID=UPI003679F156